MIALFQRVGLSFIGEAKAKSPMVSIGSLTADSAQERALVYRSDGLEPAARLHSSVAAGSSH